MDADEAKTIENQRLYSEVRGSRRNQNCETPSPTLYTVYKLTDPMGKEGIHRVSGAEEHLRWISLAICG